MAKKEVDGEGLNIPNRIKALPVKRPGPVVAAVIVVLLAAMLIQGMITNPRLDWPRSGSTYSTRTYLKVSSTRSP
jgi:polar amino acid transport system permease protein